MNKKKKAFNRGGWRRDNMESRETAWKLEHFSIIRAGGNKLFMRCFLCATLGLHLYRKVGWLHRQFSSISSISKVGILPIFLPRRSLKTEEYHKALHLSPFNWMDLYFRLLKKTELNYADNTQLTHFVRKQTNSVHYL